MIEKKNYSGKVSPDVGGETEFTRCNFSQPEPVLDGTNYIGTRLFPGDDTPRYFTRCNLVNCELPPGSTATKCNTTIRRTLVQTGTDEIVINGTALVTPIYHDVIYGRLTGPSVYEYHPSPIEIPNNKVVE